MPTKSQHSKLYSAFRERLRAVREDAGFTQRELALRLRKPQSWVHNSETGNRRVDIAEFAAWSLACGLDPVDLFQQVLLEARFLKQ